MYYPVFLFSLFEHLLSIMGWSLKGRFLSRYKNRTCWLVNSTSEHVRIYLLIDETRNHNFCFIAGAVIFRNIFFHFSFCLYNISSSISRQNFGYCSSVALPRFFHLFIFKIFIQDGRYIHIYIYTKYIKVTAFQTSPVNESCITSYLDIIDLCCSFFHSFWVCLFHYRITNNSDLLFLFIKVLVFLTRLTDSVFNCIIRNSTYFAVQ